jgi:hypothetical protein
MEIPVLVEKVAGDGYVARVGSPFNWSAEGPTPDEAVRRLREESDRRLAAGVQVASLTLPAGPAGNPLAKWAGTWKDDPMIDEFERAIAEYREQIENDPTIP